MASNDRDYERRLQRIRDMVTEAWKNGTPIPWITDHGEKHCQAVEDLIQRVVPKDKMRALSDRERFLLVASAWLHDIGMNASLFVGAAQGSDLTRGEIGNLSQSDRDTYFREVRDSHADRSARFVEERCSGLLEDDERDALMTVCRLHRYRAYQQLHNLRWESLEGIRLPLLIAYLRLADALHIPGREATREYTIYLAFGMDHKAKFHWLKSNYARGVLASPSDFTITIHLRRPRGIDLETWRTRVRPLAEVVQREAQDELDSIKDILGKAGLAFYQTVHCEAAEDEDQRPWTKHDLAQLNELTDNIGLFNPSLTPNASHVAETVLDVIQILADQKDAVSLLTRYMNNVLANLLEGRACHVFLWTIQKGLSSRLGNSKSLDEAKRARSVRKWASGLKARRRRALNRLPAAASGIVCGSPAFLVYGYSESVVKCLAALSEAERKRVEVYVCEAATKTDHRYNNRLVYHDGARYAKSLKDAGLGQVFLIPDSAVSHVLQEAEIDEKRGVERRKVSAVLFGANGIGVDGSVAHTLGHLTIADAAARYNTPVYVIADSLKIGELHASHVLRDSSWLPTDVGWERDFANAQAYNPREDIVPPDRITAIITEKGVIAPDEVWTHLPD